GHRAGLGLPSGVLPMTPKSLDLAPAGAPRKPSAASPRLSSSRTAEARLGMRLLKRKSSTALSSSGANMICSRSSLALPPPRFWSDMTDPSGYLKTTRLAAYSKTVSDGNNDVGAKRFSRVKYSYASLRPDGATSLILQNNSSQQRHST